MTHQSSALVLQHVSHGFMFVTKIQDQEQS